MSAPAGRSTLTNLEILAGDEDVRHRKHEHAAPHAAHPMQISLDSGGAPDPARCGVESRRVRRSCVLQGLRERARPERHGGRRNDARGRQRDRGGRWGWWTVRRGDRGRAIQRYDGLTTGRLRTVRYLTPIQRRTTCSPRRRFTRFPVTPKVPAQLFAADRSVRLVHERDARVRLRVERCRRYAEVSCASLSEQQPLSSGRAAQEHRCERAPVRRSTALRLTRATAARP